MTYRAVVTRGERYWIVRVPEIGRATQARHLRELDAMTKDLISVMTGKDAGSFTVDYELRLPRSVAARLRRARRLRELAARAQARASDETRAAARELHERGLPLRDIGRALGVSYQRAHQLVSAGS
ncbi:MAG TPA: hypothetical protein VFD49_12330 [Candidatus Dormibacteraeota bacterium]|nr:hypothetical protein [Candidatus Dormibacteraeota bacterium]